jgi:hypothetical protein
LDRDSAINLLSSKTGPEERALDKVAVELSYAGLLHHIFQLQANVENCHQDRSVSSMYVGDMLRSCRRMLDHWYNSLPSPLNQLNIDEYDGARGKVMSERESE